MGSAKTLFSPQPTRLVPRPHVVGRTRSTSDIAGGKLLIFVLPLQRVQRTDVRPADRAPGGLVPRPHGWGTYMPPQVPLHSLHSVVRGYFCFTTSLLTASASFPPCTTTILFRVLCPMGNNITNRSSGCL